MLALFCLVCAGYAQKPQQERLDAYQKLEEQRLALLDWPKEHFLATYWGKEKKIEEAQEVRQQQYKQFPDVEKWKLQQAQAVIKQLNEQITVNIPYVNRNLFQTENLTQLAKDNPQLFKELLRTYPENLAQTDAEVLLKIMMEDQVFAAYFNDYVTYLESYALYPQCVSKMRDYYKNQIRWSKDNKTPYALMSVLADGCKDYAAAQGQKQLAQRELQHLLRRLE